jgi:hypothetical protein
MIKLTNRATDFVNSIDDAIKSKLKLNKPRTYLGGSYIGKECERDLWYSYHNPQTIEDPRVSRIMDMGHLLESYCISLLKHSGYEVFYEDENGKQFGFEDGIFKGNIDAVIVIDGKPLLLEVKSANEKRFKEMVKVGIEQSDPVYYYQVQSYMHKMDLDKCLFFVINKNDCDLHAEFIDYNKMHAEYIINRGLEVVNGEIPPRKYKTKAFFRCKFCRYSEECWNEDL